MQFEFSANSLDKISVDAVLVLTFQGEKENETKFHPLKDFKTVDKLLNGAISKACETAEFSAKKGETFSFFPEDKFLTKWIIVLGLGKKSEFVADDLRQAFGKFAQKMHTKIASLAFSLPSEDETSLSLFSTAQAVGEGLMLGAYEFNKYKSKEKKEKQLSTIIISGQSSTSVKNAVEKARVYSEATILARDLVNEQSAVATPTYLANFAEEIAKKDSKHIKCQIFNKEQAKKLGMDAFLGIARAAATEPKFIFLEYTPDKISKKEKLAIVGKGITFDSGGINIKTGDHMQDMKMDMAGAAVVLAVFSVISEIKPNFAIIGLIAATPNMISGSSLVPGDVVKAMNGKTIEILNTDAEGRVTLADSLSYAVKIGATKIIDVASLTGAIAVALGTNITGLFSNNHDFAEEVKKAAFDSGEKVWEMPMDKEFKELNKSEVADIANIPTNRYGESISAAFFLEEFVDNKPWVHLDVGFTAFAEKANNLGPKGGTGCGVRTVLNLLS